MGGDAAEYIGIDGGFDEIADFGVGLSFSRFGDGHLEARLGDDADDFALEERPPAFRIYGDGDADIAIGVDKLLVSDGEGVFDLSQQLLQRDVSFHRDLI